MGLSFILPLLSDRIGSFTRLCHCCTEWYYRAMARLQGLIKWHNSSRFFIIVSNISVSEYILIQNSATTVHGEPWYHHQQNKWYPKGVHLPISKLHSTLALANLLAHYKISQICYISQISLQIFLRCHIWGYHLFCWIKVA